MFADALRVFRFKVNFFWLGLAMACGSAHPALAEPHPAGSEAAPEATPKAAPCALLTLEIKPQGAATLLDGQFLDQNVWLISVLPGLHTVEVRKAGYQTFSRDLDLQPGARLQVSVVLQKVP